tara:strand:+ start:2267 stop:2554 length:288 start_codon:yes stop_codon:yes gene_type:complete
MKTKEEVKAMEYNDLELYYFLRRSWWELDEFLSLIKGKNNNHHHELFGKFHTIANEERKVINSMVLKAKKATHHDDVYASITIISNHLDTDNCCE